MRNIRRDEVGIWKGILILGVIVIALALVLLVVVPSLMTKALTTKITVVDTAGVEHVIYNGANPLAIVTINGIQVSLVKYATDFTAASPNYKQYMLTNLGAFLMATPLARGVIPAPSGSGYGVQLWMSKNVDGLPVVIVCQNIVSAPVPASFTTALTIGTKYSMGTLIYGHADGNTASVSADAIINAASLSGCSGTTAFTLTYVVQLTAQASGTGSLPSSTYFGYWNIAVQIVAGSITLTGTITSSTQAVAPSLALEGA